MAWMLWLLAFLHGTTTIAKHCSNVTMSSDIRPDIVWINLDKSQARRQFMLHQLKFYNIHVHHRVGAFLPSHVFVDEQLSAQFECNTISNDTIANLISANQSASHSKVLVQSHCGRPKNSRKELAVTLTHLNAIRTAIYDKSSRSEYAVILEDDLQFAVQVNFSALIATAPPDFGVLQIVTSNEFSVMNLYKLFKEHRKLWVKRRLQGDNYWCAGGYIINKRVLKPYIDSILRVEQHYHQQQQRNKQFLIANIVAGKEGPTCLSQFCCNGSKLRSTEIPFCVKSPGGYQADYFLFSLTANTYMLSVPIMTGSAYGNTSTLHQAHVHLHVRGFNLINAIMQELYPSSAVDLSATQPLLSFLNTQCRYESSGIVVERNTELRSRNGNMSRIGTI